jgi:hypothetical protein
MTLKNAARTMMLGTHTQMCASLSSRRSFLCRPHAHFTPLQGLFNFTYEPDEVIVECNPVRLLALHADA